MTIPGSKMESRKLVLAFVSVEEMIQMKATEQYFHMAPFVLKFGSLILFTKMFFSCSLGGLFSSRSVL